MEASPADLALKSLLAALGVVLKDRGFKRAGSTFHRETEESLQFINFQKRSDSTKDIAVVTVNLGCELKELHRWLKSNRKIRSVWDCLWNERIGAFQEPPMDKWWWIPDVTSAGRAAMDICELLPAGLARMELLSTEDGVRHALESGILKGARYDELREFVNRPPGSEHWPGWDKPIA